jgi:uncharacterized protein YegL
MDIRESQRSRRLPVYILADTSGSMAGEPIVAVNQGLQMLKSELENEPRAVQTVWLCLISFGGQARLEVPLTELMAFNPPRLGAGGGTPLGEALRLLNQSIDEDLVLTTGQGSGDYKPLVFIFTDGEPTDDWRTAAQEVKQRARARTANIIAVGCGPQVNDATLKELTESAIHMDSTSAGSFQKLIQWMSQSVKQVSVKPASGAPGAAAPASTTLPPLPANSGFTVVY